MKTKRPSRAFVTILFTAAVLVQAGVAQDSGKQNQNQPRLAGEH